MSIRLRLPLLALLIALLAAPAARAADPAAALWDMSELTKTPKVTWGEVTKDGVKSLYYEGEPFKGKPTRVFAYYAAPKEAKGKVPAMVLVHGGGGTAFPQWAALWARRGYAAIAMDLGGCGPNQKRLDDGGPGQSDKEKFEDVKPGELKEAWTYHAVAAVVRAHSLIRSLPEVDAERTGLTGISWGGYLTCMTVGVDDRFKVAVPVYGCGFLHDNSTWLGNFKKIGPERAALWVQQFDPSSLLSACKVPTLWVNGTNDFAYPLDSYKKSYQLVKNRTLCVTVRMPHGHEQGWAPKEIGLFVDQYLATERPKPFPKVSTIITDNATVTVPYVSQVPIKSGQLHYTTDKGVWKDRKWQSIDAKIEKDTITAALPADKGIVYFVTLTDDRGVTVSTEHEVIE